MSYHKDPNEICRDSITTLCDMISRVFTNEVPLLDEDPRDVLAECADQLSDLPNHTHDDLVEIVRDITKEMDDAIERYHEWCNENSINIEIDIDTVIEARGCYMDDDGNIYDDIISWCEKAFLDWGYHRYQPNSEINVIQCLTHFGGPGGGLWLHADGTIEYWTAWWGEHGSAIARGEEAIILENFLREQFENTSFAFECDHGIYDVDRDYGFDHALAVLRAAEMSMKRNAV